MQCTDFEKQFLLADGVFDQALLEHYASCASCQQYVQAHELLFPGSIPAPASALDQRTRGLALGRLRRQHQLRRWHHLFVRVGSLAAVLCLCFSLWYFGVFKGGVVSSDSGTLTVASLSASTIPEDTWLMQWGVTCSELDELEIDLTMHTALAINGATSSEQARLPVSADALRELSNELLMLEFDLYENL